MWSGCSGNTDQAASRTEEPSLAANTSMQQDGKRYGYQSGKVVYKMKANRETLYFDQWGKREARYVNYPKGMEMEDEITIMNEQGIFSTSPINNQVPG